MKIDFEARRLEREAYLAQPIILRQTKHGVYWMGRETDEDPTGGRRAGRYEMFTVFTKTPDCGRGEYAEEIDVLVVGRSAARAKKVAQAAIDRDYQSDLKPSKAVYRVAGFMF